MTRIIKTLRAKEDFKRIWRYIARNNKTAATNLLLKMERRIAQLKDFSQMGVQINDIHPNCRMLIVTGYRILYEYHDTKNLIEIVAIVEPYRDIDTIF